MNSRTTISITLICFVGSLTICAALAAQEQAPAPSPGYTVVWMGTLGGPQSNVPPFAHDISGQDAMIGTADTGDLDPNFPNSNFLIGQDPYIQHAAVSQHSVRTDLGALPGTNSSSALWVNATGTVAGISENGSIDPLIGIPEGRGVIWKNGQITDLGTLGGYESVAWAVNSSDQVAGCAANAVPDDASLFGWGTQTRGFLYQNGGMQDLGTVGGPDACATLLNDSGQVTGFSYNDSFAIDVFLWTKGNMQDLGGLGGTFGYPNYINNKGQVVGASNLAGDNRSHGFFWDGAKMNDLGSLNQSFRRNDNSEAIAMNEAGHIVGHSTYSFNVEHAVLWKDGQIIDLGTLPGDTCSVAWSINSKDQIVGFSGTGYCGVPRHAVLWQNGQIYDLSNMLSVQGSLTAAFYINDSGQIAAVGDVALGGNGSRFYNTAQRAFLLIPSGGGSSNDGAAGSDREMLADRVGRPHNQLGARYHVPGQPAALRD